LKYQGWILVFLTFAYDFIYSMLMWTGPDYKSCLLQTWWKSWRGILCH